MAVSSSSSVAVLALCSLALLPAPGESKLFRMIGAMTQDEVEVSLASELVSDASDVEGQRRLERLSESLRPTYEALPKTSAGRLGHQAVRYLLHRFFVQRHGWYIKGIDPGNDTFHASSSATDLADWVPNFLQSRFEERLGGKGLDLHELAALADVLEGIIQTEATKRLKDVYEVLKLSTMGSISEREAEEVMDTYMMIYVVARKVSISNPLEAARKRQKFAAKYRGWMEMDHWLHSMERQYMNSSGAEGVEFGSLERLVKEVGEQYGSFNDRECRDLKGTLMDMEGPSRKAGRIRLAKFYNMSLYTHWKFTEKVEYLRALGVLDESNASEPLIILPNYVSARPNCLEATTLYAVCCRNECEDLMGQLENVIGGPAASVERVVEIVSTLSSDTVRAPRTLSPSLLGRLRELASTHHGKVPLHGRLFAQWMHHAFPRECPYPHEAGTTNPETADQWMKQSGQTSERASEEEIRKVVEDACPADAPCDYQPEGGEERELPWTQTEELLGALPPQPPARMLCGLAFLTFGLWGAFALWQLGIRKPSASLKRRTVGWASLLAACVCGAVLVVAGLLDSRAIAMFLMGCLVVAAREGNLLHRAYGACGLCRCQPPLPKADKSSV